MFNVPITINLDDKAKKTFRTIIRFCKRNRLQKPKLELTTVDGEDELNNNVELTSVILSAPDFPQTRKTRAMELLLGLFNWRIANIMAACENANSIEEMKAQYEKMEDSDGISLVAGV